MLGLKALFCALAKHHAAPVCTTLPCHLVQIPEVAPSTDHVALSVQPFCGGVASRRGHRIHGLRLGVGIRFRFILGVQGVVPPLRVYIPQRLFPQRLQHHRRPVFQEGFPALLPYQIPQPSVPLPTGAVAVLHFWSRLFHLPVSPDRHRCSQFSSDWRLACSCVEQKIPCSRSRNRLPHRVGARPIHSLVRQGPSRGALRHHARCIRSHEADGLVSPFHELVDPVKAKCRNALPLFVQTHCPDPSSPSFDDGCAIRHHLLTERFT